MHVIAASSLNEESLNAYCREHVIYPEDIKSWRHSFIQANAARQEQHKLSKTDSKEDKKRINASEKELKRKEKALVETAALLVLKKS